MSVIYRVSRRVGWWFVLGLVGVAVTGRAEAQSTRALYGMEHRWAGHVGASRVPVARPNHGHHRRYEPVRRVAYREPALPPAHRHDRYDAPYPDRYARVPVRRIGGPSCPEPRAYAPRRNSTAYVPIAAPQQPVNVTVQAPLSPSNQLGGGRYVGRGILGQPTVYADGQPVRNLLRAFVP